MRSTFLAVSCVVTVVSAAACRPVEPADDDAPPRVVGVDPPASVVPVTTTFRVAFSEELNDKTVVADPIADNITVVLVPRFAADGDLVATEQFLSDLANPPLIESRQNALVPIIVALIDGGTAITVAPRAPLLPGTAYSLIISGEMRDTAGNPLVDAAGRKAPFIWELTTDAGPPTVASTDIGPSGIVEPNRKRITVAFNQPVVGVSSTSLRIDGSPAPSVAGTLVDEDRRTATIVLADVPGACARLAPNGTYALVATSDIAGDNGEPLEAYSEPMTTGAACDLVPNLLSGLEALASDVSATIRFATTKPSTSEVRFGVALDGLDCGGLACPVIGAPTTSANGVHSVALTGLTVDVDYHYTVFAEDQVGAIANATSAFRTEALPKVAVSEALADTAAGSDDSAGEFVELVSFEAAASIALDGWQLRVTKAAAGSEPSLCPLPSPAPSIAPNEFLVLADVDFDDGLYGGIEAASVMRFAAFCALVNEPLLVELLDDGDRPVSSLTLPTPRSGISVERTAPDAPDDSAHVCFSVDGIGATPGRANSVVVCE
jgi:hypothetical protein